MYLPGQRAHADLRVAKHGVRRAYRSQHENNLLHVLPLPNQNQVAIVGRAGDSAGLADRHGEEEGLALAVGGGRSSRRPAGQAGGPKQLVQPQHVPQCRPSAGPCLFGSMHASRALCNRLPVFRCQTERFQGRLSPSRTHKKARASL